MNIADDVAAGFSVIFMVVAPCALLGVVYYGVCATYHLIKAALFDRTVQREIFDRIPPFVRRVGCVSAGMFVGSLVCALLAQLIAGLFK